MRDINGIDPFVCASQHFPTIPAYEFALLRVVHPAAPDENILIFR